MTDNPEQTFGGMESIDPRRLTVVEKPITASRAKYLTSYSWTQDSHPTIIVPGMRPVV